MGSVRMTWGVSEWHGECQNDMGSVRITWGVSE